MGLEGLKFFLKISVVREDWSVGCCLLVNGGILGVFLSKGPNGGVVSLVLRDKHNPDDIHEWHIRHAMYLGQNALYLVKYLCGQYPGSGGYTLAPSYRKPSCLCLASAIAGGQWPPCT
jgi:hypothetical protein